MSMHYPKHQSRRVRPASLADNIGTTALALVCFLTSGAFFWLASMIPNLILTWLQQGLKPFDAAGMFLAMLGFCVLGLFGLYEGIKAFRRL